MRCESDRIKEKKMNIKIEDIIQKSLELKKDLPSKKIIQELVKNIL